MFYAGWARHVSEERLADAALAEALASDGWCKVYADRVGDEHDLGAPPLPADRLAEVTRRVHAAGGRVAVHAQTAEGSRGGDRRGLVDGTVLPGPSGSGARRAGGPRRVRP